MIRLRHIASNRLEPDQNHADAWIAGGEKCANLENLAELAEELAPYWRQIQAGAESGA